MAWMSTLFAMMACGAQFDIETNPMRQKQSSLYGEPAAMTIPVSQKARAIADHHI
jgi:hypothetical protein